MILKQKIQEKSKFFEYKTNLREGDVLKYCWEDNISVNIDFLRDDFIVTTTVNSYEDGRIIKETEITDASDSFELLDGFYFIGAEIKRGDKNIGFKIRKLWKIESWILKKLRK